MNIVICGAGETGSHAAEVLASNRSNDITIVDIDHDRVRDIEDTMDVATFRGNVAEADVLREAGCAKADLVIAATDHDEVNLLCAAIAKGIGAKKTIARVHHATYFEQRGLDYQTHLGIDRLICPEYSTALAIARTLRNPGALAIEDFARGTVEMQEFPVTPKAPAIGKRLQDLALPTGTRLCAITRKGGSFLPEGGTEILEEDIVILVGNSAVFPDARRLFHSERAGRRDVVIMGGTPMAVWLCRALRDRDMRIRLFDTHRERAESLAEKISWVTVLNADATNEAVFEEEQLGRADVFIALLEHDEHNILGCALAKSKGVATTVTVVQRTSYLHLLSNVGIDKSFSPRQVAVRKIEDVADDSPLRITANLAEGIINVYRVRVGAASETIGKRLRAIKLTPHFIICAVQHEGGVHVPTADDTISANDTVLVVGRVGNEDILRKMFATG